jgi:hypothetical protein
MSNFTVPINYKRDVIMQYDNTRVDDIDYIEQKNKIVNEKNGEQEYTYDDIINPIFSPDTLIKQDFNIKDTNTIKTSEFDPYLNYLDEKGLSKGKPQVRYNIDYINIDSLNRTSESYNNPLKIYQLNNNSLDIINNTLRIHVGESVLNDFNIGDKISITNITPMEKIYNSYDLIDSNYVSIINFIEGKSYAVINFNPNVNIVIDNNTLNSTLDIYKYYDTINIKVKISGVIGTSTYKIQNFFNQKELITMYKNDINSPFIGNIPVAFINDSHQIYLLPPGEENSIPEPNKFYIKLPYAATGNIVGNIITPDIIKNLPQSPAYLIEPYQITFTFNHYNLIPLNEINADFPVNYEKIYGYQIIDSKQDDYISIKLYPYINLDLINEYNFIYTNFGGNNIQLNLIKQINYGYPTQNQYTINLEKIYTNVVEIKLVDSLFKNPVITFIDKGKNKNNMLYFQSIENIETIQNIEIPKGYYTTDKLKETLEYLFYQKSRISNFYNYLSNYSILVDINEKTNIVSFKNYKKAILSQPIRNIIPTINITDQSIGVGEYIITIEHTNHGISEQSINVIFSGFIDDTGLQASDLNGEHLITIIDKNTYQFTLKNINLSIEKTITHGGNSISVLVPSYIKFYFNYPDSAADVFGFRNGGFESSITKYAYEIKNSDMYKDEQPYDSNGNQIEIKNNAIKLKKYLYFMMMCKEVGSDNIINACNLQNMFAKFRITDDQILNNEFTATPIFYYNPLTELSKLSFSFYNPDNTLIDFNNEDHSFVLQITTIDNIPELTELNSNMSMRR